MGRTFAEILEKEEDLEFASDIVQKLNTILVTSPELAEFRKRLKSLETRVGNFYPQAYQMMMYACFSARWTSALHDALSLVVS
ncbi:hypothetical protein PAXINDRAFT_102732 [Paxillus involutus ATCC 200175]|uniref:Vacuolar protein 14 C-terminal Fig4-binding domain-containing protein n=1 Tax=Paxillus involutus ATCC 200175 TaxID=664439 RepID=A0A0C9SNI3_PAXIN|nr:hypothetical protein PAXINDRAFT_102732 [Paxillus involutus ATCC 200175]